jgi:hypothetical protein
MIADLAVARARLLPSSNANPIHRVCDIALALLTAQTPLNRV